MADTWTAKTAMTTARWSGMGGTIGSDKCYIVGGLTATSTWTDKNEEYSQSGDSWASKTVYPSSSELMPGGAAVIGSDTLYKLSGGLSPNRTDEYSQSGNSWTAKTDLGVRRTDFPAAVGLDSDKGYATGGSTGSVYKKDHDQYSKSGDSWTAKTDCTQARGRIHGLAIGSDKLYVVSGYNFGSFAGCYEYSQTGNSWATKTANLTALTNYFASSAAGASQGYVIAGTQNQEYDQGGDSWVAKAASTNSVSGARGDFIGEYKAYYYGGDGSVARNYNQEYTAADPPVIDALEDLRLLLDAEWPTGLEYLKTALEAVGWSMEDLKADVRTQAYTALADLKAELGGDVWGLDHLKVFLDGYAQSRVDLKTDVQASDLVLHSLGCELKTRDTQGPYVFNSPSPAPGQTSIPVNTNIALTIRDDGWGVDI
ncbi:MAG: hypothetical protein GY800_01960, partial [Planctomycetes bacterium]|nr:hypothetical protein [Planctomycetota bacterium]